MIVGQKRKLETILAFFMKSDIVTHDSWFMIHEPSFRKKGDEMVVTSLSSAINCYEYVAFESKILIDKSFQGNVPLKSFR